MYFGIAKFLRKRKYIKTRKSRRRGGLEFDKHKKTARLLIEERIRYFNNGFLGKEDLVDDNKTGDLKPVFNFRKIFVKNQKTRWGSCSKNGNLNFNYRLAKLNLDLVDYIIVHELCHLVEFNHSPNFWRLVSQYCPNYKEAVRSLKKIRFIDLK